jgi:hypothetical protein
MGPPFRKEKRKEQSLMSWIQKTLITFGAFWLSLWVAPVIGWPLDKLTNRITYTDTVFNAFALGVINSLDRTLAAMLTGILVTVVISGRRSELWAIIVAVQYLVDTPRFHWLVHPTGWDRIWQSVALVFPAVACLAAAFITAHFRRNRSNQDRVVAA